MFRKGGSANSGIMDGLNRKGYVDGTNWEDIAAAYGATGMGDRDDMFKFDWSTMAEPPMGTGDEGSDWLPKWYEKQDPLYKEYKTYLEGEGGIAPGEKGGQGYVGPEKIITGNGKDNGIGDGRGKERGDLDDISVSDLNKKYLKMMAPGMQKRMINDALAAASAAFGESTGDTKQDIANAISAAAAGMGGTKDIYDKVSMLTLSGEIQKDIEAAKGRKPNLMESKIEFLRNVKVDGVRKYSESDIADILTGAGEKTYEQLYAETGSQDTASRRWAKLNYTDVVQTFSAADSKDVKIEDLADGVYYIGIGKDGDRFFRIEGGKIDDKFSRPGVL